MNQLTKVFQNELFKVSAKIDDGQPMFDAEEVAKSLGFVTNINGGHYVRWKRVNDYLPDDLPQVAKGDYIPESLVYKLAFKASNDLAEKFQDWLAIEVIPSIRKEGMFKVEKPKTPAEMHLEQARVMVKHDERISLLEETMRIDGSEEHHLKAQGNSKVVKALGGKRSPAYKELSRQAFAAFWRDFKNHFMIPRYGDLPKRKFDEGLRYIELWQPDTSLRMEVERLNNQQVLEVY